MRIHRLVPLVVSLAVLAAITVTVIRFSSVGAQDKAAVAQLPAEPLPPAAGGGFNPTPAAETTVQKSTELYLDADEVESRAQVEQADTTTSAVAISKIPVSFKAVPIPLPGGIDHAVAGVGTRHSGGGVIRLRGIPPGSTLLSALLVWGEIAAPPALNPYNVVFGPDCGVAAVVAGTPAVFPTNPAAEPFWNPAGGFFTYMAAVTAQIQPGINGDYRIRGLRSFRTDHRCPWDDSVPGLGPCTTLDTNLPLSEGASLIVIYSNPCIPRAAQLYISLGPQMFFGPHSVTHATLPIAIRPNLPNLKHSRIGGDGQVGFFNCGMRAITAATDERTWIENPVTGGSIQIKGDVGGLSRDSDWNGYDGEPLNKLWDSHTDVFANSNFLAGGGGLSYRVRYLSNGDGVVWVVHILGVR
ncbi:MAG TPA: hypothetical protein VJ810_27095 [Blastocatellia bacterium]|nr:hypothetical protein [Blastocatellia bacterium]